jgi:hypothetical protein
MEFQEEIFKDGKKTDVKEKKVEEDQPTNKCKKTFIKRFLTNN